MLLRIKRTGTLSLIKIYLCWLVYKEFIIGYIVAVLGLLRVRFPGKQVLGWRLVCRALLRSLIGVIPLCGDEAQSSGNESEGAAVLDAKSQKASAHSMGCSGTWRGSSVLLQAGARSPELYMGC